MTTVAFQWEDYLVFSIMLVVSSAIGLYFGITYRRKKTLSADDMLTGNRNLPVVPVALSLNASFMAASFIMGIPAEVYVRGGEEIVWILGIVPCFVITGLFVVPMFHKLKLTNAYEYLELRYNKFIRYIGSLAFCVIILLYMATVLYAPAVALSQVTGISKQVAIVIMGVVCTFYTGIGGIRAVVWTDAFQLLIMWVGLFTLVFKGASDVGGWGKVWEIANNGSRLPRFEMNPDPFIRHTFWAFVIGGGSSMMCVYGGFQVNLQRYASIKTKRGAQIALLLNIPLMCIFVATLCVLGLVMYAYFPCDPLANKVIKTPDQLVPYFVLETMGSMPGLPGLFMASLFSASISTLSSGINSLAAVTLEDLIKPLCKNKKNEMPSQNVLAISTMGLVCVYGAVSIGIAFVVGAIGKTAFMVVFNVFGMIGGPLLALILNGIFVPYINSIGAGCGMLVSLIVCFFYGIYPIVYPPPKNNLPARQETCSVDNSTILSFIGNNFTMAETLTTGAPEPNNNLGQEHSLGHPYLSYLHLSTVALVLSFVVASVVSLLTGCNKGRDVDGRTYYKYSWCREEESSYHIAMVAADDKCAIASTHSPNKVEETFHSPTNSTCIVRT